MQRQESTVELEQGSSSSNSSVDRQVYWSNVLNPMGTRDIADCLIESDDTVMSFTDVLNPRNGSFNHWNFSNPESSQGASNRVNIEEAKRDHEWTTALLSTSGTHPRLHERRFEAGNMLSLDNLGINVANDQSTNELEYNSLQNTAHTRENSDNGQTSAPCHFFNSSRPDSHHVDSGIASANPCSSSAGGRFLSEDVDGRLQDSMDGRYGSGKRKMIEGASGQSSTGGIVNHLHHGENSQQTISLGNNGSSNGLNISNPSNSLGISLAQGINSNSVSVSRAGVSGSLISASAERNSENTHRNVRRRANPALEHDLLISNLWPPVNPVRHANMWPPCQPSVVIPYAQLPEVVPSVSTSASQPYSSVLTIPSLPQNAHPFTWNGTSNSRTDSSSSSIVIAERFPSRRVVRSIPVPTTDARILAQDPTNWNLSTGGINPLGNVASTSRAGRNLASNSSAPTTWPPHQLSHMQHPLRSDSSRRSHSSFASDTGIPRGNIRVQDPTHSTTSQEVIHNPGTGVRIQQRYLRSALLVDRHIDGLPGVPLSIRMAPLREGGRSRVMTEQIRGALDVLRRGLPYELVRGDILRLESLMFGGLDLHDRHRDMRLDVDNMSYEELLALEERIGNVNTGLTEETVMKHLKQWKYIANSIDKSDVVAEPCCICQEEYTEDEDLGTLHCGHSFHSQCIKQWLSYKNLCPVCKTTALNT